MEFYLWMPGHHRLWTSEPSEYKLDRISTTWMCLKYFHFSLSYGSCFFWSYHSVMVRSLRLSALLLVFLTSDECNLITTKNAKYFRNVISNIIFKLWELEHEVLLRWANKNPTMEWSSWVTTIQVHLTNAIDCIIEQNRDESKYETRCCTLCIVHL